jgi:hypothetical protein
MKFTCVLPDKDGTTIEFYRNSFFGSLTIRANGKRVYSISAFNPFTHFGVSLTRNYEFSLPGSEPRHVCITKERPLFLAGFRPNCYRVSFNGVEIGNFVGT